MAADTAVRLRQFHPDETIDTTCNILVVANADLARRAASDLLMTLQTAVKLTGAVVFTHSTDPLLLGNVLPDEVVYRDVDYLKGAKLVLGMQRDAHRIRAPENTSDTALHNAVRDSNVDRIGVVMDLVNTASDFRNSAMRDLLQNGGNENIVNIICVSNASAIPPDVRSHINYVMLGYTNVVHDIKNAWKSVFGMFESHKDLQDMITDLDNNMLLVAKLNSSERTLTSMLYWYMPNIYCAAPVTRHIVENRGKWHLHPGTDLAAAETPEPPEPSGRRARARKGDSGKRKGGDEGDEETDDTTTAEEDGQKKPRLITDKVFQMNSYTIVAIHGALRHLRA